LTVRRCLLLCNLPWVSLLEASLACKVPPLPREADKRDWGPPLLGLEVSLFLMRHTGCMTMLREWLVVPRDYGTGKWCSVSLSAKPWVLDRFLS
jgi:hypothetical protein